jgi:hypothetical protein
MKGGRDCINKDIVEHFFLLYNLSQTFFALQTNKQKLHGLSPQANCTDSATAACFFTLHNI